MPRTKPEANASKGLIPEAASLCTELLETCRSEGIRLTLTSTLRTAAEQDALYAQGRMSVDAVNAHRSVASLGPITPSSNRIVTSTRRSAHMEGRAFDVAVLKDGAIDWNATALYERAGEIGKRLGLRWGGDFKSLRDLCHFELPTNPTHKGAHGGPINNKHQEDTQMSDTSTVKSGLRTSEFYMALIGEELRRPDKYTARIRGRQWWS